MSKTPSSAMRRLSVVTLDQMVYGASNVLLALVTAHLLGVAAFGLFGLVFTVAVLVQGVSRALICDPLLVEQQHASERPGQVLGGALSLGLVLAVVVGAGGLMAGVLRADMRDALLVLALGMPLLVLQDVSRYISLALHRPSRALILDTVWLVLMVGAIPILVVTDSRTLVWFVAAWVASGSVSGLLALLIWRGDPLRFGFGVLRVSWFLSWRYLISYGATQGSALLAGIGVTAIASARALGAVRAFTLLTRPFIAFFAAAQAAGVAEVARFGSDRARMRRHAFRTTGLTTAVAGANALVFLFLPDWAGEIVLGQVWEATEPLVGAVAVHIVSLALIAGPRSTLLGDRATQRVMVTDLVFVVINLTASLVGAALAGALGFVWAVAGNRALFVLVWWWALFRHLRPAAERPRHRRSRGPAIIAEMSDDRA